MSNTIQSGNVLTTLHAKHFSQSMLYESDTHAQDKHAVVGNVVDNILKNHPDLLVNVSIKEKDKEELDVKINEIVGKLRLPPEKRKDLIVAVHNYLFNYGRLQELIEDEDVTDIDIPRYNYGVIKRNGVKELLESKYLFSSEKEFRRRAQTWIVRNEGILNENLSHERVADSRYKLRINVSIPPRNFRFTSLNIRKHRQNPYTIDDLVKLGMITKNEAEFLIQLVKRGKRFLLAGRGAAGKTTLLRAMMMQVNDFDTYLVAEKDAELYLDGANFIQQRIKKKNQGGLSLTLGDLVKDGLTMSLDGYCVGEIVGEEAWHTVNAGVTDHVICGSIHASSCHDVPPRLRSMIETYNPGPKSETIDDLIARSLDYVIHLKDFKVSNIAKVGDFNREKNVVEITSIRGGELKVD
jgi:pilus assembly protein CpaF